MWCDDPQEDPVISVFAGCLANHDRAHSHGTMVKSFKESHAKDLEKLAADLQCQSEKKATEDLVNTPKHTVLSMAGLTSEVWTLGMFQMVTGESCQCIQRTKQTEPCHVGVRHAACTVPKCGFVTKLLRKLSDQT